MAEVAIPDHLAAFRRAARPGVDPHQHFRFWVAPGSRAGTLAGRLHGMTGTIDSALAVVEFALRPGPGPAGQLNTFYPGASRSNLDFGFFAIGDPDGTARLRGVLTFFPIKPEEPTP